MNKGEASGATKLGSVDGFLRWARAAPAGTKVDVDQILPVLEQLAEEREENGNAISPSNDANPNPSTWREKLWCVPAQTRLGTEELAEALGRPRTWIYARTQSGADNPLPHAKLDGSLVFRAGEIRAWIEDQEKVMHAGPMMSTSAERELRLLEE